MKRIGLVWVLMCCLCFCSACSNSNDGSVKALMEVSSGDWPAKIEEFSHLKALGCPLGTVKEEYTAEEEIHEVRFSIDEEMTQTLVDGFAKAVWTSCLAVSDANPHNCNYYQYSSFKEACRKQEPLNYYIWYYFVNQKEYRVGIYPTMLEEGEPGGLVLRIEAW